MRTKRFITLAAGALVAASLATGVLAESPKPKIATDIPRQITTPDTTPTQTVPPTSTATSCVGDCNGNHQVTVDELLTMVNIALGNVDISTCTAGDPHGDHEITVDEILAAVNNALHGCPAPATPTTTPTLPPDMMAINGVCLKPGPSDLVSCDADTVIKVWRCDDDSACTPGARTLLGEGLTDSTGRFSIPFRRSLAQGAVLSINARIDNATDYDLIMDIAPIGTGGVEVTIDPSAEATVRLLDQNGGLQNFSHDGITIVLQAVRTATQHTTFAGLSPSAAADQATEVASHDPMVKTAIQQSKFAGSICFDNELPTSFDLTLDTSLTAAGMKVNLTVLYQGSGGNPISDANGGGCECPSALRGCSFTYPNQPGMVQFTLLSASPRPIPTSPLFSCNINLFYSYPIVVSCLSASVDDRPLKCCATPFKTVVVPPPGSGCCQFDGFCLGFKEYCTIFGGEPFQAGYRCNGVSCNQQE